MEIRNAPHVDTIEAWIAYLEVNVFHGNDDVTLFKMPLWNSRSFARALTRNRQTRTMSDVDCLSMTFQPFQLSNNGYSRMAQLMCRCLDDALNEELIHHKIASNLDAVLIVLISCQTWFKIEQNRKVYVQTALLHHELWKQIRFWDEALFTSFQRQLIEQGVEHSLKSVSHQSMQCIGFSELLCWTHTMIGFQGISCQDVVKFITKHAMLLHLDDDQTQQLLQSARNDFAQRSRAKSIIDHRQYDRDVIASKTLQKSSHILRFNKKQSNRHHNYNNRAIHGLDPLPPPPSIPRNAFH